MYDNKSLTDNAEIANISNKHFSSIASKPVCQLTESKSQYNDYLKSSNFFSLFFIPMNSSESKRLCADTKLKLSSELAKTFSIFLEISS